MLVIAPDILTPEEVARCRAVLEGASWVDGRVTAGVQSARTKHNLQAPEGSDEARELGNLVLRALGRSPTFNAAALPHRVFPPLFNRYDVGMGFGTHVDNAIRPMPGGGARIRTDVSTTLFLSEPDDYDGGELVIQGPAGDQAIKLKVGSAVIYSADTLHRVQPVTRGSRWASFFWTQSMVKDAGQRALLYDLDLNIQDLRQTLGDDHPGVLRLTATYHNLIRRWAEL
jgi:PKHD-type hydroxylase